MTDVTLLRDRDWAQVADVTLRLSEFVPLLGSRLEGGKIVEPATTTAYASLRVECVQFQLSDSVTGFLTHKLDFAHAWEAFRESGLDEEVEEVIGYWSRSHYSSFTTRLLAFGMPRMVLLICDRGTFDQLDDGFSWGRGDHIIDRIKAMECRKWWKPDVMQ